MADEKSSPAPTVKTMAVELLRNYWPMTNDYIVDGVPLVAGNPLKAGTKENPKVYDIPEAEAKTLIRAGAATVPA